MREPSPLWRAVLRAERFLPRAPLSSVGVSSRKTAKRRRFDLLVVFVPFTLVNLAHLTRGDFVGTGPEWRAMMLDGIVIAAGAILVAGAAFGVHAWRAAKRGGHA